MTTAASDQATLDFYQAEAPVYAAAGRNGASRWLGSFMCDLPAGARVRELGCGGGRDAEAMIARGFDVDPTDGSPALAAKAAERLGRPVRVMRFDEITDIATYDAVWASASLLHVPFEALPSVLALIWHSMKPGGLQCATFKAGGVAGRDTFNRYFNYPDSDALNDAYHRAAAWHDVAVEAYVGGGYEGGQGSWFMVRARR